MALTGGQDIVNDDDPWRVSAFISALMELFLSVLLFLGATIAFITSQLVTHFGLEPPCTYIGCSHTQLPNSKKEHGSDCEKEDLFHELCSNCHSSQSQSRWFNERILTTRNDADISCLQYGGYSSLNDSSTSSSDADVPHLDEETSAYSDSQHVKYESSANSTRKCSKCSNLKQSKSKASGVAGHTPQSINEDCIPLFPTRSVSAFGSISNAQESCQTSPTSCWITGPRQQILLQREAITCDDASVCSSKCVSEGHRVEHHYMLLDDDDGDEIYHDPFCDTFEATSGSEDVHGYMVLDDNDDDDDISESGNLHSESAQPLLSFASEAISEGGKLPSTSPVTDKVGSVSAVLRSNSSSSTIMLAEASYHCDSTEHSQEPRCTDTCGNEHHYMLLEGDDDDARETPSFIELNSESAQPLLNGVSDDELEVPISCDRGLKITVLLDSPGLSGIEQSTKDWAHPELPEVSTQTTQFEEQEYPYTLLGDDDEDCSEAPYLQDMVSDCAQPLLQGINDGESESLRHSDLERAKPPANVGDSYSTDIEQSSEDNANYKSPETSRESVCPNAFRKPDQMQDTEAPLQGFLSVQLDTHTPPCPENSTPLQCYEAIVKDDIENSNHPTIDDAHAPPTDLLAIQCMRTSKHNHIEDCLLDVQSGCTASGDHSEVDKIKEIKPSESDSHSFVAEEALVCGVLDMELQKQASRSQETPAQDFLTGLCTLDAEKPWVKKNSSMPESHEQVVGKSNLGFMKKDVNKAAVVVEVFSIQDNNANKIGDMGNVKIVSNALSQTETKEASSEYHVSFVRCSMADKPTTTAENINAQQPNVGEHERVLDSFSHISEEDKEEFRVDEENVDSLKKALWAEKKMLAVLETELENERNAAAIATSEAMAMISRLQEEKSAMKLEVAQLQRMAEEKAEYDDQAMALLKEILFKRETEKHALEKEVELYRERLLAEKRDIAHKKEDLSMPSSILQLSLSRTDEGQGAFLPEGCNDRLKNLPSLDKFHNSEGTFLPGGQSIAQEEHAGESFQFANSPELGSSEGFLGKDQVDTCLTEDKASSVSSFTRQLDELHHSHGELRETSRSVFSTNDEETQFILERLRAIEEELRELRRIDRKRTQKKSYDVQCMDCSPVSGRSAGSAIEAETGGLAADENGIGVSLPVHDVYEVHCAPSQQDPDIKGHVLVEYPEFPEELRSSPRDTTYDSLAPSMHCQSSQAITYTGKSFLSSEILCDNAIIDNQVNSNDIDEARMQSLKVAEGGRVLMDIIQQLAVRLHVLETNRQLLREILESFRHRDAELKLLQEIAQQLRELRMFDFGSMSTSGLQAPMSATFGQTCAHAFKKRRFCSDSGEANMALLHQRSI